MMVKQKIREIMEKEVNTKAGVLFLWGIIGFFLGVVFSFFIFMMALV